MNTNPDEAALALWLDDELAGDELAAVEAWATLQPQQLAAREQVRRWRTLIAATLPAAEEPPYPEFFNSRLLQSIRQPAKAAHITHSWFSWKSWLLPSAACAGMALTFWVGTQTRSPAGFDVAGAPKAIPVEPVVYTPETGVKAEWLARTPAAATIIVLNGVAAIPDSANFSETAAIPTEHETDSTAQRRANPVIEVGP